jgi:hypothetical protein
VKAFREFVHPEIAGEQLFDNPLPV